MRLSRTCGKPGGYGSLTQMVYHILLWCLALLASAAVPLRAEQAPLPALLDAAAVPHLGPNGRADYQRFLQQPVPRAFAVSTEGAWGWAASMADSTAQVAERALANCRQWGSGGCRLYALDLSVVWPGREVAAPFPPTTPLRQGPGWAVMADPRFLWQGPQGARGAYVWAHGRAAGGQDSRGTQPQPHVRVFNNAGYDVLRFDRDPATDETEEAAAWMQDALASLRARGYRRIVVGGQSRGAWNALQALQVPGLVDAVVAIAPAAHGPTGSPAHAWAFQDLRQVVHAARTPAARVAIAVFQGDEFDPGPDRRAALFRALAPQVGGLLLLDRPAGLQGHGAGTDWRFTQRFGACLFDFAEGRAEDCDQPRAPLAGPAPSPARAQTASASTPPAASMNAGR